MHRSFFEWIIRNMTMLYVIAFAVNSIALLIDFFGKSRPLLFLSVPLEIFVGFMLVVRLFFKPIP
jgi:hypothetical protein